MNSDVIEKSCLGPLFSHMLKLKFEIMSLKTISKTRFWNIDEVFGKVYNFTLNLDDVNHIPHMILRSKN